MERDPRVFIMGEEVGQYQGAYKVIFHFSFFFLKIILIISFLTWRIRFIGDHQRLQKACFKSMDQIE
jgi:hypothetical protein